MENTDLHVLCSAMHRRLGSPVNVGSGVECTKTRPEDLTAPPSRDIAGGSRHPQHPVRCLSMRES